MGVAPCPLDLVHPEAVAADVVAQIHGVLDEERVEPVTSRHPQGPRSNGRARVANFDVDAECVSHLYG